MKSNLKDSYRILGLSYGASMDEVKKAWRKLARKWHPDVHQDEHERLLAENRIKQINAAFSHIKAVKKRSTKYRRKAKRSSQTAEAGAKNSKRDKSREHKSRRYKKRYAQSSRQTKSKTQSNSSYKKTRKQSGNQKQSNYNKKKQTRTNGSDFNKEQAAPNSFFARLKQRWKDFRQKRAKKRAHEQKKRLNRERAKWQERYDKYKSDHRIGFYKSPFNRLMFGYLERWFSKNPQKTSSMKSFSIDEKQLQDLQYSMVKSDLFYSVNTGANVFLKYALGFIFCFQFISNIHLNYFRGTFYGSAPEFMGAQLIIGALLLILFLPDTLFQRYVLWKYRNISLTRTRKLFFNKYLPHRYERLKNHLLIAKYAVIGFIVWMGF